MKGHQLFFLILVFLILFSCGTEKTLDDLVTEAYSHNYSEITESRDELILFYLSEFEKYSYINPSQWNEGYQQQCLFINYLHSYCNYLSDDVFITEELAIYERWFKNNPTDTKHLFSYGVLLIADGKTDMGKSILANVYEDLHQFNFDTPSPDDYKQFCIRILLDKLNNYDLSGTIYETLLSQTLFTMLKACIGS